MGTGSVFGPPCLTSSRERPVRGRLAISHTFLRYVQHRVPSRVPASLAFALLYREAAHRSGVPLEQPTRYSTCLMGAGSVFGPPCLAFSRERPVSSQGPSSLFSRTA